MAEAALRETLHPIRFRLQVDMSLPRLAGVRGAEHHEWSSRAGRIHQSLAEFGRQVFRHFEAEDELELATGPRELPQIEGLNLDAELLAPDAPRPGSVLKAGRVDAAAAQLVDVHAGPATEVDRAAKVGELR